ncbi:hypothetical protein [Paenibacillus sp. GCM10027626]|uniref:hypothetical protein n=1 Tax=Paenibacillus sp. GCM10027626 TaxID=3273411 RepID=UPI00363D2805
MTSEATTKQQSAFSFPCPGCGGPMLFNSDTQMMKCDYCGREDSIESSPQQPIEHDLDLSEGTEEGLTDWGMRTRTVHCESCGGESVIPEIETATICSFCGSPKVLTQGSDVTSIRPETMIPFQISLQEAGAKFQQWKKKRWFVPNAFKKEKITARLKGIYMPYWTYDADSASVYTAERGDYHYRTEVRTRTVNGKTETYTEQVRYTVWHRVGGEYDYQFDDVLVPASSRYESKLLNEVGHFDLRRLTGYKPEYLSGYTAEKYSVSRSDGWSQAGRKMDEHLESDIRSMIGGDEIRGLHIRTRFYNRTYKHILLPVWNAHYKYRSKSFRYMVNGQTGRVTGTVPRSPWKITIFTIFCLIVLITAYILFSNYNS